LAPTNFLNLTPAYWQVIFLKKKLVMRLLIKHNTAGKLTEASFGFI